jgi:hypothetical protein
MKTVEKIVVQSRIKGKQMNFYTIQIQSIIDQWDLTISNQLKRIRKYKNNIQNQFTETDIFKKKTQNQLDNK